MRTLYIPRGTRLRLHEGQRHIRPCPRVVGLDRDIRRPRLCLRGVLALRGRDRGGDIRLFRLLRDRDMCSRLRL